ncbi:MAG: type II toxin-antitoxin system VapC family toxin [Burkholderiaceae bacterium]|nr:type II toxin-antitoxin system VapC family toxin [Burkholderiaceae bacterium]
MAALDTNVLVRYLVRDDAAQFASARRLIHACIDEGRTLYIPISVSLELEWVLRAGFGFGKDEVIRTLSQLLSSAELTFESEVALELALTLYRKGAADYSDCVHAALAAKAGEQPLWTFDKAASKVDGASLLT